MLARWLGLATKALCSASTVTPTPTFSPSFVQLEDTPEDRLLLWEICPTLAMCAAHAWALADSSPDTARGASPRAARVALIRATNSPGDAAPAGVADVATTVARARARARAAATPWRRRRGREELAATHSHRPPPGCFE